VEEPAPHLLPFDRAVLARPAPEVAPLLLGAQLTHASAQGTVAITITEVEAYDGERDPASHAYRGKTARNAVMFGPPGHLYVYFSYGMHWCANIVTGPAEYASGVLIRAGRVTWGAPLARQRRGMAVPEHHLARGPACLTQALGIDRTHAGTDLLGGSALTLSPRPDSQVVTTANGPRVGVRLAADVPWRWWIAGDPTVSSYRRNHRASP